MENLLLILQEYDDLSKRSSSDHTRAPTESERRAQVRLNPAPPSLPSRMSAELLRLLSPVQQVREQLRELEGLPVLLSLLQDERVKLLWSVAWVLVQLCLEPEARAAIRSWGGVQQLLRLLRRFSALGIEKRINICSADRRLKCTKKQNVLKKKGCVTM